MDILFLLLILIAALAMLAGPIVPWFLRARASTGRLLMVALGCVGAGVPAVLASLTFPDASDIDPFAAVLPLVMVTTAGPFFLVLAAGSVAVIWLMRRAG